MAPFDMDTYDPQAEADQLARDRARRQSETVPRARQVIFGPDIKTVATVFLPVWIHPRNFYAAFDLGGARADG